MPANSEIEDRLQLDTNELTKIPEDIGEIAQEMGVVAIPTRVTASVADDYGQPLIQTPANQVGTIQIPASPTQLTQMVGGRSDDASSWWGLFWLRKIKQALLLGLKLLFN